jgi:hypothetical protein
MWLTDYYLELQVCHWKKNCWVKLASIESVVMKPVPALFFELLTATAELIFRTVGCPHGLYEVLVKVKVSR